MNSTTPPAASGPSDVLHDPTPLPVTDAWQWEAAGEIIRRNLSLRDEVANVIARHFFKDRPLLTGCGLSSGADSILIERVRQIHREGYTAEHDDRHSGEELIQASACYLAMSCEFVSNLENVVWPWPEGWKPGTKIRNLIKAGALIAAEIDRLRRLESTKPAAPEPSSIVNPKS